MLEQLISLNIPPEIIVMLIAALPIAELRVAIPVGIHTFGMTWYWAFFISIIGNMLPVPILLLFLDFFARIASMVKPGKKIVDWVFARTRKHEEKILKYEWLGLTILVSIPLPITGAWTGSILSFIMGLKFWPSIFSIFLGVLMAGVIVTVLSLLGWIGAIIAGVALIIVLVLGWWRI
ncbi:MAG: small multi-drug export protein [Dehalococcoidia bacterium]|nr:small multi-drug export protein [Dehalococcoidia bacterium]